MKKLIKLPALAAALAIMVSLLAGCGGDSPENVTEAPEPTEALQATDAPEDGPSAAPSEDASLPLVGEETYLTVWDTFNPGLLTYMDGWNDNPVVQKVGELTNVYIDATCVPGNEAGTHFPIMISSGDYADLIGGVGSNYTGGFDSAIDDGVIIDILPYVNDYSPDYMAAIQAQDCMRDCVTDNGAMGAFYAIVYNNYKDSGMLINKDMLDDMSMDVPKTYDELHEVLTGMKNSGVSDPMWVIYYGLGQYNSLAAGYNTAPVYNPMGYMPFYVNDGSIVFSWTDTNFKDYLTMLSQWYSEGLIWKDFASDGSVMDIKDSNARDLAYDGNMGVIYSGVDFIDMMAEEGSTWVALPEVTKNGSDNVHVLQSPTVAGARLSISSACKDVELACKYINYYFTEEGAELANYGLEGQAFNWVDGERQFTDLILNNEQGLGTGLARRMYCIDDWPFYANKGRDLYFYSDAVIAATEALISNVDYTMSLPTNMSLTLDEDTEFNGLWTDLVTYALENIPQFVIGTKSVEKDWDGFTSQLKAMGCERCTEIYQSAYERYMSK